MYIWGGFKIDLEACNDLLCFDTSTRLWSSPSLKGTIPVNRIRHSACVINDFMMFIFGGFECGQPNNEDKFAQDVFKLNLKSFEWSHVSTKVSSLQIVQFLERCSN